MSSRVKNVGKQVRERTNVIAVQAMEELFSLPLHQELKLRKAYRKHMKKYKAQQRKLAKQQYKAFAGGK